MKQAAYMISLQGLLELEEEMFRLCRKGDRMADGYEHCWEFLMKGLVQPNDLHYMREMSYTKRNAESERRHLARV